MSRRFRTAVLGLLALSALLVLATSGFAAEAVHHPAFDWKREGMKILNFLIVVGILWWLLKDRLPAFLDERRSSVRKAIEEAKAAKAEAETKRAEYEAKIAQAEQDVAQIEAEGTRRAEAMKSDLARAAEEASKRVAAEAEGRMASELQKARAELQREASLLALELSEELIKERLGEEDQRKLIDETIRKLGSVK